jgi:hypothetical protein
VVSSLRASQPKPCKHLSHAFHMYHPPHPPWYNHPNNIRWRIQAMKFIIMQFSSRSVFLTSRSKYLPQHSVLIDSQSMSSLKVRDQISQPYSTTGKVTLYILIFRFFIWDGKTKDFALNDRKHSLNLTCSKLHHECQSDLLLSSPSIWILPHFQTIR